MQTANMIKCSLCDKTFPRGYTNKKGIYKSGYSLLLNHVFIDHTKEYMELQEKLNDKFGDEK